MSGLRLYKNKRDAAEKDIVEALRKMGCLVELLDKPVDLLIKVPGVKAAVLAECKTGKGKLTQEQSAFIASGWEVFILRDVQDAINLVNMVRRAA